MSDIVEKFGKRLREIRKEMGRTQEEISQEIGVDRTYVGKIERGERSPSLEKVERLSECLDVEIEELFKF
jgi:transcriptional regulator with XRE-family HTH domain